MKRESLKHVVPVTLFYKRKQNLCFFVSYAKISLSFLLVYCLSLSLSVSVSLSISHLSITAVGSYCISVINSGFAH